MKYDKTVIFGVISMGDPEPETPETVAARIRAALARLTPERLLPAPDCGMKYIPRDLAFAKLKAWAEGAAIVRRELLGTLIELSNYQIPSRPYNTASRYIPLRAHTRRAPEENARRPTAQPMVSQ